MATLMQCGHSAQGIKHTKEGNKPICLICLCTIPLKKEIDLSNRKAKCTYCDKHVESSSDLAFFEHKPTQTKDAFYCGCTGWE